MEVETATLFYITQVATKFLHLMEHQVINFLEASEQSSYITQVVSKLMDLKSIVPRCLKLSNIFFTQLSITTSNGEKDMEIHVDKGNIINTAFHFCKLKSGGSTLYFENEEKSGMIRQKHAITIQHGQVQIDLFSNIYITVLNYLMESILLSILMSKTILRSFSHTWKKIL